jgi:tetratricopeptide (TPR) repeat protein
MGAGASLQVEAHSPNPIPPLPTAIVSPGQPVNLLQPPAPVGSSSSKPIFPSIGLKFSLYEDFLHQCGDRHVLEKLTTKDVVEKYILSQTSSCQLSYCEMLQRMNHPAVSTNPTVYVIHSWGDRFLSVLDALRDRYGASSEVVLWWDIFCLNQHQQLSGHSQNAIVSHSGTTVSISTPRRGSGNNKFQLEPYWVMKTIPTAIKQIGRAVLAIGHWDGLTLNTAQDKQQPSSSSSSAKRVRQSILPLCLHRTWCLYEIFSVSECKAQLDIALSQSMQNNFLQTIKIEKSLFFNQWRDKNLIDLENSQGSYEEDQRLIVDHIQASKGDVILNNKVLEQVRTAFIEDVVGKSWSFFMANLDVEEKRQCQLALIDLYSQQGGLTNWDKAFSLCQSCLQDLKQTLGETHAETIHVIILTIGILKNQQKLQEAETLLTETLTKTTAVYTEKHVLSLSLIHQLAELQIQIANNQKVIKEREKRIQESERFYRQCWTLRQELLGERDSEALKSQHALAMTYLMQGKHTSAEELLQDCLSKRRIVLGKSHPETFETLRALCFTSLELEKDNIADPMIQECRDLVLHKSIQWQETPYQQQMIFITFLTNLGDLYAQKRQDFVKAEQIYVECLDYKMTKLSLHHASTLNSWLELAMFYIQGQNYLKAMELLTNCYDFVKKALGMQHPFTLHCMKKLIEVYQVTQRYPDAVNIMQRLLRCYRHHPSFGEKHSVTIQMYQDIGDLLYKQDEYEKAIHYYQECYDLRKELLGEEHTKTIAACGNLAICYEKMQRNDRAEPLFTLYYQSVKKSLGETHPKTIAIGKNLQLMRANTAAAATAAAAASSVTAISKNSETL